jgi:hypothetical protein
LAKQNKYQLIDADTGKPVRIFHPLEVFIRIVIEKSRNDPILIGLVADALIIATTEARRVYRSAGEIEKATGMTHKQLLAFLRKHPAIKTCSPRRNRLDVDVADFMAVYRPSAEALFNRDTPILDDLLRGIMRDRYLEEFRLKADG